MTDTPSARKSRSRMAERSERLYTSRADDFVQPQAPSAAPQTDFAPNEIPAEPAAYMPNEEPAAYGAFTPNEQQDLFAAYTPNEERPLYEGYTPNEEPQPAFAVEDLAPAPAAGETYTADMVDYTASNVYRPREVTWAEEDREEAIAQSEMGYCVEQEEPEEEDTEEKRRAPRRLLIVCLVLVVLLAAAWLLLKPAAQMLGVESIQVFGVELLQPRATETPAAAVATPVPVKAYDAAPAVAVADTARNAIARLCGTLPLENYIVTEQHIVGRTQRGDGLYDFYLFTAPEGRLLCYFEGLESLDMIPQAFGGFYVEQSPWLVTASGSALIRTADIEAALNEKVFLHPMYRGWAVVESTEDGHANYVNANGQLLSSLWFSRTFPFTGENTLAYVDTGSTAAANERYLLYVIAQDGTMNRWMAADDMEDVLVSACGMAYMTDGTLYDLADTASAVCVSPEVIAYADCDALVVRDEESGKYGLFVHGEQHYGYVYDSIRPLESDIVWAEKTFANAQAAFTLKAVSGENYPQPLSHSFVLERDGQTEYVALSTQSSYPIRLDGEF